MEQQFDKKQKRGSVDGRSTKSGITTISVEQLLENLEDHLQAEGKSVVSLDTAYSLSDLGKQFIEDSNFEQAESYLNQALTMYLGFEDTETEVTLIRIQLGFVYIAQKEFGFAQSTLEEALKQVLNNSPQQADAYYYLGLMHKGQQHYADAATSFETALSIYQELEKPADVAHMHYHLGLVYLAQNQHDLAESHLKEAVSGLKVNGEDDDKMAEAYRHLGLVQQAKELHSEALASFQSAIEEFAHLDEKEYLTGLTHYQMGTVYFAQSNYSAAITSFHQSLEAFGEESEHADVTEVQYHLGLAENAQGNLDKALEHWNTALTQYASDNEDNKYKSNIELILNCMGTTYQAQGEFPYAISSFNQVLALYADLPASTANINIANTHRHIGEVHLAANNLPEAKVSLLEAARMYQILEQHTEVTAVQRLLARTNQAPRVDMVVPPQAQVMQRPTTSALSTTGNGSTGSNDQVVAQQGGIAYLCSCCGLFGGPTVKKTANAHKAEFSSDNPLRAHLNHEAVHLNEEDVVDYGSAASMGNGRK